MTETTNNEETVSYHADVMKVNKLLVLPTQLPQRLDALKEAGCTVTYTLAGKAGLTETYHDVNVSGPAAVATPGWQKLVKDLGIRIQ